MNKKHLEKPGHWTDDQRRHEAQGDAQNAHAPQVPMACKTGKL